MSEIVYRNLGELVAEAKKKYGFSKKHRGKKYPLDHKNGSMFTTGFYRVFKVKRNNYKQGFCYQYRHLGKDGYRKDISSVDIKKLYKKVKDNGFKWEITDEVKAQNTIKVHNIDIEELR